MRSQANLDEILKHPAIWRIGQMPVSTKASVTTGHPTLDAVLPAQGWVQGEMTELLSNEQGIGELLLLIPALRQMTQAGRSVVLIAPPYLPFPAGLESWGVRLNRLVLIQAEGEEQLWAIEQASRSGACGMVVAWGGTNSVNRHRSQWHYPALRRLQVAADNGNTALMVYRPANAMLDASPAPTRLVLSAHEGMLQIKIAKRRGALLAETIALNVHTPHWQTRTVQHLREVEVAQQAAQQAEQQALQERRNSFQHRLMHGKTPVSILATLSSASSPQSSSPAQSSYRANRTR